MITSDRDVFIGAHFTEEIKEKFRTEADRRKTTMSALLFKIIEQWLKTASSEELEVVRSNKRGISIRKDAFQKVMDPLKDIPLPYEEKK